MIPRLVQVGQDHQLGHGKSSLRDVSLAQRCSWSESRTGQFPKNDSLVDAFRLRDKRDRFTHPLKRERDICVPGIRKRSFATTLLSALDTPDNMTSRA